MYWLLLILFIVPGLLYDDSLEKEFYNVSHPYYQFFLVLASFLPPQRYRLTVIGHKYNLTMLQLRLMACIYITAEFPHIFFTVKWRERKITDIQMYSQLNISHSITFIHEKVACLLGSLFCHLFHFSEIYDQSNEQRYPKNSH